MVLGGNVDFSKDVFNKSGLMGGYRQQSAGLKPEQADPLKSPHKNANAPGLLSVRLYPHSLYTVR